MKFKKMFPRISFAAAILLFSAMEGSAANKIPQASHLESLLALARCPWNVTSSLPAEIVYEEMALEGVIDFRVFKRGYEGLKTLSPQNNRILTLVDFTKPSDKERFFVLDLESRKLLYRSHVAHGRNSGNVLATSFSNKEGSYKSSPGFYLTENTYNGRNGYSLVLNGLEKEINDNAKKRAIVVHGSNYVSSVIADATGRVGRSLGCPALPKAISKNVINTIKNGTLFYIHSDNPDYLTKSDIV